MRIVRNVVSFAFKGIVSVILIAILAIAATSVSFIYDFREAEPFHGPDIFDPYRNVDTSLCWKRANFHTHTKVKGILNECDHWPGEVLEALERFGYDIITFSNHNELTAHPSDSALEVNVYEHGYNLFKYHKLVFGSSKVIRFDHLIPFSASHKQFQLDILGKDADFIQMNHPTRTIGTSKDHMQKLSGYMIMELDSGKSTENEYWDWALSAGHYSFGLAGDDLHYPDRSHCIAVRCSFLCCQSARYEDIRTVLSEGAYYSMRIPDYGHGDWERKLKSNKELPYITSIGLKDSTIYMSLSEPADSIKVTGQDHTTLARAYDCRDISYTMVPEDHYARLTAYFEDGEVIYSNPFARYDSSLYATPICPESPSVNIILTILYNMAVASLCCAIVILLKKLIFKR